MSTLAAVAEIPTRNLTLELTRVIAAPQARVFDAWTRPDVIRQWFAPGGMMTAAAETEPVKGGSYAIQMQGALEDEVAQKPSQSKNFKTSITGTYTKISPYDLLQFTWNADWTPEETSLVTLHFRSVEGGTELRLVHERFASEKSRDGHVEGWAGCLDHLAELFAR